jgi:hypothetical protein
MNGTSLLTFYARHLGCGLIQVLKAEAKKPRTGHAAAPLIDKTKFVFESEPEGWRAFRPPCLRG